MKKIKATANQRLDKFLQEKFPQYSRAFLKEQIKQGNFLIGGKEVKPSYVLRQGEAVALAPGFILPQPGQILPNPNIKLKIIYQDENVIVLDKPAGLAVHPRQDKNGLPLPQEIDSTLVSGLLAYYPDIANVGDASIIQLKSDFKGNPKSDFNGPGSPPLEPVLNLIQEGVGGNFTPVNIRPGIVHRLDKDTSGVMIIAKNQNSFDWLKKQFKERLVNKKYLALAHGLLKNKEGEIKTLLVRAKRDPTKQKVLPYTSLLPSDEGRVGWGVEKIPNTTPSPSPPQLRGRGKIREAITQYKVIKEFKNYTLLEASPKTGRLHQIRVHLVHLSHPVVGDKKYGKKNQPMPAGLSRQFLHAAELKIALPDGQKKTFNVPLPADLCIVLAALENK